MTDEIPAERLCAWLIEQQRVWRRRPERGLAVLAVVVAVATMVAFQFLPFPAP